MGNTAHAGMLSLPPATSSLVLFAHGSGSSRFSRRNKYVADVLNQAGIGTLLFDLLSEEEDRDYQQRFDVEMLAERLEEATLWVASSQSGLEELSLGYFGASTGAAAALMAASYVPQHIRAVVSRGGRPDLASNSLARVAAPTLLIVGGNDLQVLQLNQMAFELLRAEKALEIVSGATHLFEEPGTLEQVAKLASAWFHRFLNATLDSK
ncbi:MAG: alpha/beta family hydrolase [Gammaproteobacteria bacterium]